MTDPASAFAASHAKRTPICPTESTASETLLWLSSTQLLGWMQKSLISCCRLALFFQMEGGCEIRLRWTCYIFKASARGTGLVGLDAHVRAGCLHPALTNYAESGDVTVVVLFFICFRPGIPRAAGHFVSQKLNAPRWVRFFSACRPLRRRRRYVQH
jgi:hypothetical protein